MCSGDTYPALVGTEQKVGIKGAWGWTASHRDATSCAVARVGERRPVAQTERWRRLVGFVDKLRREH